MQRGTLSLDAGNDALGGTIQGGGELDLRGGGTYALSPSVLSVDALGILDRSTQVTLGASPSYGGRFTLGNFAQLNLNGQSLALTGADDALLGTIAGGGTIALQGAAEANQLRVTGGAQVNIAGALVQDGVVNLGTGAADSASVSIASDATYDILGDFAVNGYGSATIANAGLLEKTGGGGTSIIGASVASSGTLLANSGTLSLFGPTGSLSGTLAGAGELDIRGGGQQTLAAGSVLSVATFGVLDYGTQLSVGSGLADTGRFVLGTGATLAVASGSLTLSGTASLAGTIGGPGTVSLLGAADLSGLSLTGKTELDVRSVIIQHGALNIGTGLADAAMLLIESGATYALTTDDAIVGMGAAAISNSGLFAKSGPGGISTVGGIFSNTGTVAVSRGTLEFAGTLDNDGVIAIGGAGANAGLLVAGQVGAGTGSILIGSGATVVLDSEITTGGISFTGTQGLLELAQLGSATAPISGFASGDTIDLGGIAATGVSYANGQLVVTNGATTVASLNVPGIANPAQLALVADGNGGTEIVLGSVGDPPPNVTVDNWVVAGGDWSTAANWQLTGGASAVPSASNAAVIAPTGTAGFAVTYSATGAVDSLSGGTVSSGAAVTLAIGGGVLTVNGGGTWSGSLVATGGTFDASSGFAAIGEVSLGTASVAEVDAGTLALGGGSLAGTIRGAGEAKLIGQATSLRPGLSLTVATVDIAAGSAFVTLEAPLSYGGNFVLDGTGQTGGSLNLNGQTIGLGGAAQLNGAVAGPGSIRVSGAADLDGLALAGSALLDDSGTVTQSGAIGLGTAAADASVLQIDQGAVYDLLADATVNAGAAAAIRNAGLFEKTGSNGTSTIAAGFTSTGTIVVASGVLSLAGSNNNLGGTISGAGTLLLGPGGSSVLAPGVGIGVSTLDVGSAGAAASTTTLAADVAYGGAFVLARNAGTVQLSGHSLLLSGSALLDGAIVAGGTATGTLVVSGSADVNGAVLSGPINLTDSGAIAQDGALTLASGGSGPENLQIAAGATYNLMSDVGIANGGGAATITNTGLFEKTGAFGTSTVSGDFTNTGTILAERGTLMLADGAVDNLGGTLAGAGQIAIDAGGTATVQSGAVLSVATLGLYGGNVVLGGSETYAGDFLFASGATLTPNGSALVLSGTASLGGVQNGGSLEITGTADANGLALEGTATLDDAGLITQDGNVALGTSASDASRLVIEANATYDIIADININSQGNAAIVNNGLFEKTAVNGISYVFANLTNNGTIAVADGTVSLRSGQATLGGRITGAGEFDVYSAAGTYSLNSGLTLDVAAFGLFGGADLVLGSSRNYAGAFTIGDASTLALNGQVLGLSGTVGLDGIIAGAGTLNLSGSADANGLVLAAAAVLNDTGVIVQDGAATLGSGTGTAVLNIGAAGTYDLVANIDLAANGSAGLNNAGLLEKTGGAGLSTVGVAVGNTGTIAVTSGTLAFGAGLINDGSMRVANGELLIGQSLVADSGRSGGITLGPAGTAVLQAGASSAEAITFDGAGSVLGLAQPMQVGGTLGGFRSGDTIDLVGATFTAGADVVSFAGQVLSVANNGTTIARLNLAGSYSPSSFRLADDGAHGTQITVPCFAAGTHLLTPTDEVPVERLAVGEQVLTLAGQARPIVWTGHRRIACARHPAPEKVMPVRVRADAFAPNVPHLDVLLSPDHGVFVDNVLIPVKHLINGVSIRQESVPTIEYFHIELATHDVVLAEGLAVESYLDSGNRAEFTNGTGYLVLHPRFAAHVDRRSRAPLCTSGAPLAATKRDLLSRLQQDGYTITTASELRLVAAGREMRPAAISGRLHRFILPDRTEHLRIVSRSGVPAESDADSEDRRRLGVAIECVLLDGRVIALDGLALADGFHGVERDGPIAWRWTNGNAGLAMPAARPDRSPRILEILIRATTRSWLAPAASFTRAA